MQDIVDGFLKSRSDAFLNRVERCKELAHSQSPGTLFITCSDSRSSTELPTQCGQGDLFVIRNAGNIVPSYGSEPEGVLGKVGYAVAAIAVTDVITCGHSDRGSMTAILTSKCLDHMPGRRELASTC